MTDNSRALVLGGGGVTGVGWEIGLLAQLAADGREWDLADLVVGTSAGSVVGAQLTSGVGLERLYEQQLEPPSGEIPARLGLRELAPYLRLAVGDERRARAWVGRRSLRAGTVPEEARREVIAGRLPVHSWPEHPRLVVTAVDALAGTLATWDAASGIGLVEAVAASCAVPMVWPPMTINGRRYIDGGVRSPANADLATGCSRVLVVAPITGTPRRSAHVSEQLARLGPSVQSLVISPDEQTRAAIGRNSLDPAFRAAAAQAGRRQASTVSDAVKELWS